MPPRTRAVWCALAAATAAATFVPARTAPAAVPPVALVVDADSPDADAAAAALREVVRRSPRALGGAPILDRAASSDDAETRAALAELGLEGVSVVIAVGDRAGRIAAEAVRDRPVVAVVSGAPGAPAPGGRVRTVVWSPDPARVAEEVRRIAPDVRRIGVAGPADGLADAVADALRPRGAAATPAVERLTWSRADGAWTGDVSTAELVVAAADTPEQQVTDLARRLAGQGVALVGGHATHLGAGAAAVLRTRVEDAAALAAEAAADAAAGGTGPTQVLRPRRIVRELHLPNARRLRFVVPLAVLAASDRTVAPTQVRR